MARLLSAYAGREAERHRLLWALDGRMAELVATTSEPMIGQIRLAWWREALGDAAAAKGRGEPLVDAMRAKGIAPPPGLSQWLGGWEALLGDVDLPAFAAGRGGGLFRALAGQEEGPDWLARAGAVWALWDLSGHSGDPALAEEAVLLARRHLPEDRLPWPAAWKPLRIAFGLARGDVEKGRRAPAALTPGLYLRLMGLALRGR
ncbi:phytoene synthase [Sphingobium faniae]|nr:phytoene synthase [Sphingobium faniae]